MSVSVVLYEVTRTISLILQLLFTYCYYH